MDSHPSSPSLQEFSLSDEQWALIQPLLEAAPGASPTRRTGRPLLAARPVVEAILWKFSTSTPWDLLPSGLPSCATCYRLYRRLCSTGQFPRILYVLYRDLVERGGFDLHDAVRDGLVKFYRSGTTWKAAFSPTLEGVWQLPTARIFTDLVVKELRQYAA